MAFADTIGQGGKRNENERQHRRRGRSMAFADTIGQERKMNNSNEHHLTRGRVSHLLIL